MKRLFFDIETSPNIVFCWSAGYKINIGYENILKERAIICICWKWEKEDKVYSLQWDEGDDKKMVHEFYEVIVSADEIVGHNGDGFDIKWFRTRCLFHGIKSIPPFVTHDTLSIARSRFRFNSNRLDYIGQYLGFGGKIKTDFDMWKEICLKNDETAMNKMVKYCKQDVVLLEKIFNKLTGFGQIKTHVGVMDGGEKHHCPECGSPNTTNKSIRTTAFGIKRFRMVCKDCSRWFTVSSRTYADYVQEKINEGSLKIK